MKFIRVIAIILAISISVSIIAQDTDNRQRAQSLLDHANRLLQRGEFETAINNYILYLRYVPDSVEAITQRAFAYASLEDFESAFADIETAFEIAGFSAIDQAMVLNIRAQIYFVQDEDESALADFNRALELNPDVPKYWLNRGILHQFLQDWDDALADHDQYLALNPDDADAQVNRARIFLAKEDRASAVDALTSAIEITPQDPELYIFRGSINLLLKRFADAGVDYAGWLNIINVREFTEEPIEVEADLHLDMAYGYLYRIPFEAESGDRIGVSAVSTSVDSLLVLLDPDGNPIMANDDGGQGLNAFFVDFSLPEDGTYTILVGHARGGWSGTINLVVQIVPTAGI